MPVEDPLRGVLDRYRAIEIAKDDISFFLIQKATEARK
jgi:hypothetical protein